MRIGLTPAEEEALEAIANTANALYKVIGTGPQSEFDMAEAIHHVHSLQSMIMSNVCARAYPDRFRVLGATNTKLAEPYWQVNTK